LGLGHDIDGNARRHDQSRKNDVGRILDEALSLPPEARVALASSLIDSLDTEVDEHLPCCGGRKSGNAGTNWIKVQFKQSRGLRPRGA
jgi:hypothetical protein